VQSARPGGVEACDAHSGFGDVFLVRAVGVRHVNLAVAVELGWGRGSLEVIHRRVPGELLETCTLGLYREDFGVSGGVAYPAALAAMACEVGLGALLLHRRRTDITLKPILSPSLSSGICAVSAPLRNGGNLRPNERTAHHPTCIFLVWGGGFPSPRRHGALRALEL